MYFPHQYSQSIGIQLGEKELQIRQLYIPCFKSKGKNKSNFSKHCTYRKKLHRQMFQKVKANPLYVMKAPRILWKDFIFRFCVWELLRGCEFQHRAQRQLATENYCYQESAVKKKKRHQKKLLGVIDLKPKLFPLPPGHFLPFFLIAFQ